MSANEKQIVVCQPNATVRLDVRLEESDYEAFGMTPREQRKILQ